MTEAEKQSIIDEAEKLVNYGQPEPNWYYETGYIAGRIEEREAVKENIRQAIIDEWKEQFGAMDKELEGVGVYFITGFVSSALTNYQNKTP